MNWRDAVKQAMYDASIRMIAERDDIVEIPFNYRWEHVKAVASVSQQLAELTGADEEIVEAAAWLHDIEKNKKENHHLEGADFARKFLLQTDFPTQKIDLVAKAIEDHMGLWLVEPLTNLESKVLWDADKLTKIGVTALIHRTVMHLVKGNLKTTREIIDKSLEQDWIEKTVASMHFEQSRKAAKLRLKSYKRIWNELGKEISGLDLMP